MNSFLLSKVMFGFSSHAPILPFLHLPFTSSFLFYLSNLSSIFPLLAPLHLLPITSFLFKHSIYFPSTSNFTFASYNLSHLLIVPCNSSPLPPSVFTIILAPLLPHLPPSTMTNLLPVPPLSPPSSATTHPHTAGSFSLSQTHLDRTPIHTQMMNGYYKNEQATRESFDADGFLKTGDVVTYDEEGNIQVVDRVKELIKVKGIQVRPRESSFRITTLFTLTWHLRSAYTPAANIESFPTSTGSYTLFALTWQISTTQNSQVFRNKT